MNINFKTWSNLFFIIPLYLSIYHHIYFHSILILLVIIFSTLHHIKNEKKFNIIDQISATLLILSNLYLCYLSNFKQPYFLLALLFVIISFYFYFKNKKYKYNVNHSLWHIFSVIITLLCLLAYIK